MPKNAPLTVSVIIPVFNESLTIANCLEALVGQVDPADEVIVVDNNCTDDTIAKARQFDFVTVVHEPTQGMSPARNAGFDSATGDILLSIDADTIMPPEYVAEVRRLFSNPVVNAATGYATSRFELVPRTSLLWTWFYFAYAEAYFGHKVLWGSNMAIRARFWPDVKPYLINDDEHMHEDQDLSLALASIGVSCRAYRSLRCSVMMEKAQQYGVYRLYRHKLKMTKRLDQAHPRFLLESRLKKSPPAKRALLWLVSAWAGRVFGVAAFVYSAVLHIRRAVRRKAQS